MRVKGRSRVVEANSLPRRHSKRPRIDVWFIPHHEDYVEGKKGIGELLRIRSNPTYPCNKKAAKKISHVCRNRILQAYLPSLKSSLKTRYDCLGKPYIAGISSKSLNYSISHTHQLTVLAVGQHCSVGVDIEHINPFTLMVPRLDRTENKITHSLVDETAQQRLMAWVQREACLKVCGTGFKPDSQIEEHQLISMTKIMRLPKSYMLSLASTKVQKIRMLIIKPHSPGKTAHLKALEFEYAKFE